MGLNECTFLLLSCINLVKPIKTSAGDLDINVIRRYNLAINRAAQKYDISPYLLLGILKVESDFGRVQTSQTRDHGPMQINEWWFSRLDISRKTVRTPEGAMYVAAKILSYAREDNGTKGCWWSAYHSVTPVHRKNYERQIIKALGKLGFEASCASEYLNDYESAQTITAKLREQAGVRLASLKK